MSGDMVTTRQSGDDPSWLQKLKAFRKRLMSLYQVIRLPGRKDRSLVLYNVHRTDALDVSLQLPAIPQNDAGHIRF